MAEDSRNFADKKSSVQAAYELRRQQRRALHARLFKKILSFMAVSRRSSCIPSSCIWQLSKEKIQDFHKNYEPFPPYAHEYFDVLMNGRSEDINEDVDGFSSQDIMEESWTEHQSIVFQRWKRNKIHKESFKIFIIFSFTHLITTQFASTISVVCWLSSLTNHNWQLFFHFLLNLNLLKSNFSSLFTYKFYRLVTGRSTAFIWNFR